MNHEGRGEFCETIESRSHKERALFDIVDAIRKSREADHVFIPPNAIYEQCAWQFDGYSKPLLECSKWELDQVCQDLFNRCRFLQAKVDALEANVTHATSPISLMR